MSTPTPAIPGNIEKSIEENVTAKTQNDSELISQNEAQQALSRIQEQTLKDGLESMSLEEINFEIAEARMGRRKRNAEISQQD